MTAGTSAAPTASRPTVTAKVRIVAFAATWYAEHTDGQAVVVSLQVADDQLLDVRQVSVVAADTFPLLADALVSSKT